MKMKNQFHIKSCAINLISIQRPGGLQKWPLGEKWVRRGWGQREWRTGEKTSILLMCLGMPMATSPFLPIELGR